EDLLELVSLRDLELAVATVARAPVGPPAEEHGGVPEPVALQVVILDLAHPLDAQRLPREVLARAPSALAAGHPRRLAAVHIRPAAPGMVVERALAEGCQLDGELSPPLHRERGRDPDVVERTRVVVEPKQQRADQLAPAPLVPPEAGDHTIGRANV